MKAQMAVAQRSAILPASTTERPAAPLWALVVAAALPPFEPAYC